MAFVADSFGEYPHAAETLIPVWAGAVATMVSATMAYSKGASLLEVFASGIVAGLVVAFASWALLQPRPRAYIEQMWFARVLGIGVNPLSIDTQLRDGPADRRAELVISHDRVQTVKRCRVSVIVASEERKAGDHELRLDYPVALTWNNGSAELDVDRSDPANIVVLHNSDQGWPVLAGRLLVSDYPIVVLVRVRAENVDPIDRWCRWYAHIPGRPKGSWAWQLAGPERSMAKSPWLTSRWLVHHYSGKTPKADQ